jgi:hypothetical protein
MVSVSSGVAGDSGSYWVVPTKAGGTNLITRIANGFAILIGVVAIVGWIFGEVFSAGRAPTGEIDRSGDMVASELRIGDCFDFKDSDFESVDNVASVPCSEPHAYEVSHVAIMPEGTFPGVSAIDAFAEGACFDSFDAYVGRSFVASALGVSWIYPGEDAWAAGDRTIQCFIFAPTDDRLTQSVKGSGR